MKATLLLLLLSTYACLTFSQDISRYLDDGIPAMGRNVIKIAYNPLYGELPLIYEHAFGKKFSLEGGAGPVWNATEGRIYIEDTLPIQHAGMGYTFFIRPKIYFHTYPERFYISSYPKLTVMDGTLFWDIAVLNFGYQRAIRNKIIIAVECGVGFRIYKTKSDILWDESYETLVQPYLPIMITLGYLF